MKIMSEVRSDTIYLIQKEMLELTERKERILKKLDTYKLIHAMLYEIKETDMRDRFIRTDVANFIISLQTSINSIDIKLGDYAGELKIFNSTN